MSIHRDCGAQIRWAKRHSDPERFERPLEYAGLGYIIDESGTAIEVVMYQEHVCNLENIKKQREREELIEARTGQPATGYELYQEQREEKRKEDWKVALMVNCETCGAKPRNKCRNMSKGKNFGKVTKNPHPARLLKGLENVEES